MANRQNITNINLEPWEEIKHYLDEYTYENSYCFLKFRNSERICIPLRDQEMALNLQNAVGKIVSILKTDIPEHEYFYHIHDERKQDDDTTKKESPSLNKINNEDSQIDNRPFTNTIDSIYSCGNNAVELVEFDDGKRPDEDKDRSQMQTKKQLEKTFNQNLGMLANTEQCTTKETKETQKITNGEESQ